MIPLYKNSRANPGGHLICLKKEGKSLAVQKNSNSNRCGRTLILFALFFLSALIILHNLPPVLDDVGFQRVTFASGKEALRQILEFGNGRFFGNGGIIFLMRHPVLGDLIRASVIAGIAVLLPKVLSLHSLSAYLLSMFLLFSITPGIFGQAYSWMSGFQNYVPPLFLLLYVLLLIQYADQGTAVRKCCRCAAILLCSVCMQFYIEHSSCLNVLTAVLLVLWLKRKNDPRFPASVFFLIGTLLGLAAMFYAMFFLAPAIHGGVQSYFSGGLFSLIRGLLRNAVLLLGMYSENAIALCLLAALILALDARNPGAFPGSMGILIRFGMLVPSVLFLLSLVGSLKPYYGKLAVGESTLLAVSMLVYIISVLAALFLLARKTGHPYIVRAQLLFAMAVISIVPVLAVWPTGYRCLFHSSLVLFASVLLLAEEVLEGLETEDKDRAFKMAAAAVLTATVLCQIAVFSDVRRMVSIRDAYLREQVHQGAESAAYFLIPSPYIYDVWNEENQHYRTFDGQEIRLRILPADVWFRMYYYQK